jgi:hypothetical protein
MLEVSSSRRTILRPLSGPVDTVHYVIWIYLKVAFLARVLDDRM